MVISIASQKGGVGKTSTAISLLLELAAKRGLRGFSTFAVGFDNIDLPAATRLGIAIGNTPGVLTEATAELAVALTLATARRVVEMDRYTREGRFVGWHPTLGLGVLLGGLTVGVVGAGRIGSCFDAKDGRAGVLDRLHEPQRLGYGVGVVCA